MHVYRQPSGQRNLCHNTHCEAYSTGTLQTTVCTYIEDTIEFSPVIVDLVNYRPLYLNER